MMNMKKILLLAAMCVSMTLAAQKQNEAYLAYIEKWKETAIQQQRDYGVPAAITMAQALLESGAGQSELAVKAKNHFGIKCTSDWKGATYTHNDNRRGECFRKYTNAAESYRDHSLFLKRSRYSACFELSPQNYEGWAKKLRECGYATDSQYAPKLVKIIELYNLNELTKIAMRSGGKKGKGTKAATVHQSEPIKVINSDPEKPYVAPLTAKQERKNFLQSHPRQKQNGIVYVVALEGDTYSNVAFRLNIRERDLRICNDALGRELQKGDRIYLATKKKTGQKEFVWSQPGLSIWQMSQDEGMTVKSIQKLNGLDPSVRVFRTRQKIYLKKVK